LHVVIQCGTIYLKKGEVFMSTITVRLNSEEARIYKEYAEFKNIPLSTLMKEALEEKIEDEIDLKAILSYEERLKNNDVEYISFDEVKKRLEI
jgi:predicted DNA-binding protein